MTETIRKRWQGHRCVVAASGPSLTPEVAEMCRGERVVVVNDAHRRMPYAQILYGCDRRWWELHKGCPAFEGEKWSSHEPRHNDKLETAKKYGLRLVKGKTAHGFSFDPAVIHYGNNSGHQAINLALLFGANPIILVGFNMNGRYARFIPHFEKAAKLMPDDKQIINCTPGSALKCFPMAKLEDVLWPRVAA